jgi:hypothetical protein
VACNLDPRLAADADRIAERMERVPRIGAKGRSLTGKGFLAHRLGAYGELVCCEYYGVKHEPVFGTHDDGIDFWLDGYTVQVKTRSWFGPDVKLFMSEEDKMTADVAMLVTANPDRNYAEIVGWARMSKIAATPLRYWRVASGEASRCRWLDEDELRRVK